MPCGHTFSRTGRKILPRVGNTGPNPQPLAVTPTLRPQPYGPHTPKMHRKPSQNHFSPYACTIMDRLEICFHRFLCVADFIIFVDSIELIIFKHLNHDYWLALLRRDKQNKQAAFVHPHLCMNWNVLEPTVENGGTENICKADFRNFGLSYWCFYFFVPEAYLTHFSYRCWFINCSVQYKGLFERGRGRERATGRGGSWKLRLFWALKRQWTKLDIFGPNLVGTRFARYISGPNKVLKSRFSWPHLFQWPSK